ncbi:MAG: hypothetical protein KDA75_13295 [Planctomycetaceae bacterium]|nr:hypothetical protein [Planctomycetaceae bacterium]
MTRPLRILVSAVCLPIAAFCLFGFLAAFEPGVTVGWKVAYAILGSGSLAAAVLPWLLHRSPE